MSFGQIAFAIGMIASGAVTIANRGFYSPWDPVATWLPARVGLGYVSGAVMILGGVGLLIKRTSTLSARVLFVYLLAILVVAKTPVLVSQAQVESNWLDYGQIATLVAGALTLATTNETYLRAARYLLGAALIPIGLSHFFYLKIAEPMVPGILPFHSAWVIFTGIAHIAAGVAVLAGVLVPLAVTLEAGMITAFGLFVWLMPIVASPSDVNRWVQFVVTMTVASGVWAVASKMAILKPTFATEHVNAVGSS